MKTYIPLKNAIHEDDFTVGFKAAILSHLEKEFNVPFSLVITSDTFFEFISYNTLGDSIRNFIETPLPQEELTKAFVKLSRDVEKASFPSHTLAALREAFELLTLDANNLQHLSSGSKEYKVLSLRRSLNYEDQDELFPGVILTKSNFEHFLKTIKSIYLSAFLPSTIKHRQKKNIKDFSIAIIVSQLPEITTCIESFFEEEENKIKIKSHLGFLDYSNKIPRDEFSVAIDFLKINERNIKRQRLVSVFDMEANHSSTKQYINLNSSSQSIEEPRVLDIARFTKKIQQAMQQDRLKVEFVSDKHNNLFLLDVSIFPKKNEKQETLSESLNVSLSGDNGLEKINPVQVYESEIPEELTKSIEDEFQKDVEKFEAEFFKSGTEEQKKQLSKMIVEFISHYKNSPFKTEVNILMQALLNTPTQGMLIHGLTLCRDIVRSWED